MTVSTVSAPGGVIEFKVDTKDLERDIERAPGPSFFWLRDLFGRMMVQHRVSWLKSKGTKFGRRGENPGSRAIKVWQINQGPDNPEDWDVTFEVRPRARKVSSVAEAVRGLNELTAKAHTSSLVLNVHETGEDISSPTWMAIPVKTRPGSPEKWREKNPGKTLIAKPGRNGKLLLFERIAKGVRGRPRKEGSSPRRGRAGKVGRPKGPGARLKLRFILQKFTEMDPTLHFYDGWDKGVGDRDKLFSEAADRIVRDIAAGKVL